MNLIQQFGSDTFFEKYRGALFLYGDDVLEVRDVVDDVEGIVCRKMGADNIPTDNVIVSADTFSDIGVMASFKPGWRVYAAGTQAVYCFRRNRGYAKGFRVDDIITTRLSPTTSRVNYQKPPTREELAYLLVKPEIIDYGEGMEMLARGERLMFTPDLQRCVVRTIEGIKDFYLGGAL